MEFSSRNNVQRSAVRPIAGPDNGSIGQTIGNTVNKTKSPRGARGIKLLGYVLFVSGLILAVAIIVSISTRSTEKSFVDNSNYQVVALVDKQAYFGKITDITNNYIVLKDVYYIQGSTDQNSTSAANTTLVKRGCEIHKPQGEMIVYREQINFWENLQKDGKVATAIAQYAKDNPKGQDCAKEAATSSTQQTSSDAAATTEAASSATTSPVTSTTKTATPSATTNSTSTTTN